MLPARCRDRERRGGRQRRKKIRAVLRGRASGRTGRLGSPPHKRQRPKLTGPEKKSGIDATVAPPASTRWVIGSPPPTSSGANQARIPTAAPIAPPCNSTGHRWRRSANPIAPSNVLL